MKNSSAKNGSTTGTSVQDAKDLRTHPSITSKVDGSKAKGKPVGNVKDGKEPSDKHINSTAPTTKTKSAKSANPKSSKSSNSAARTADGSNNKDKFLEKIEDTNKSSTISNSTAPFLKNTAKTHPEDAEVAKKYPESTIEAAENRSFTYRSTKLSTNSTESKEEVKIILFIYSIKHAH